MYKLKIKAEGAEPMRFEFQTLREVTNFIMRSFDVKTLEEALKRQKEYNIRFYLKRNREI